jgi:hypothetical protein
MPQPFLLLELLPLEQLQVQLSGRLEVRCRGVDGLNRRALER